MEKHVIIGVNGPIGQAIYNELIQQGKQVIGVGRSAKIASHYQQVDALDREAIQEVTQGASHIYLTVGLPYDHKVWQSQWPIIMDNAIAAARYHRSKLIFFDNIYMYGRDLALPIKEDHPLHPRSKKGKVRLELHEKLQTAMTDIEILVARAPDFFGPNADASLVYILFLQNLLKGWPAIHFGKRGKKHSYSYTKDLGRATVWLALDSTTYGQVWHLPAHTVDSIEQLHEQMCHVVGKQRGLITVNSTVNRFLGLIMPIMKELEEMRYQADEDYIFDWTKFHTHFPAYQLTPLEEALHSTVKYYNEL